MKVAFATRRRQGGLTIAVALIAAASPARAQDPAPPPSDGGGDGTGDLEALLGESVVTTASRSAERASAAPATVFNITAAEMSAAGVRTVDEALEFLGLGMYAAKPRDYASNIDVGAQGLMFRDGGRHVLILLDGVILNSQGTGRISADEGIGVPFDAIDHIEVMLGPGSVVYGSNAMLAVINVVTRSAQDYHGVHASQEFGVALPQDRDGSPSFDGGGHLGLRYRYSLGVGKTFRLGRHDGEFVASLEWLHESSASYAIDPFDDSATASNQSFLPGQALWGGQADHVMRVPSLVTTLKVGDFRLLASAFDYYRTMPLVGTFDDPDAREQQRGVRLDLSHGKTLTTRTTLGSRAYFGYATHAERSIYGEDFWCLPEHADGCSFELSARSFWAGVEQQLAYDWRVDGTLVTSVGYDARWRDFHGRSAEFHDRLTGERATSVELPHADNTSYIGALFAQQTWQAHERVNLNVGARLDADSEFGSAVSPRAAVVVEPAARTIVRASYNEAFRAPSAYELSEFDPTYRISPVDIQPETVRSAELEVQRRFGRHVVSARGYASFYEDFIESRPATAEEIDDVVDRLSPTIDPEVVIVNDNLRALRVLGGSLAGTAFLPGGVTLGGNLNAARSRDEDGRHVARMPRYYGNVRIGWQPHPEALSLMLVGVYASSRRVLSSANLTHHTIGQRLDLRLTAGAPLRAVPGLSWSATLGFVGNDKLPYAIADETSTPSGVALYAAQPRLFGFVNLTYAFAAD